MKQYLIIFIVAIILMGLPYLLRQNNPLNQKTEVTETQSKTETSSEITNVDISGFKFSPAKIIVKRGTTVKWTNKDTVAHTVTGDTSGPDSLFINKDESYSYTFNELGIFNYHCKPHPGMKGIVEVIN